MIVFAGKAARFFATCTVATLMTLAVLITFDGRRVIAQEAKKTTAQISAAGASSAVARGAYIVEDVAMCGTCHTPRLANGQYDRNRWLAGAPVPYQPSQPTANWPTVAPRIAGQTPANAEGMITLLTTGIWTDGKQLRDPMPKFHMTKEDAQAVVAYLKSVTQQQ